ncbi:MAG: aminoglycoside phosphotransferase family protein [Candidatus Lokiarchaeota archaeon]|nr:aminoglycoside phosphotransferase family protein [Candidatus Lokiarchaeota archaeon]
MKSKTKPSVTPAQIQALVDKHFGDGAVVGNHCELTGGWFNAAFRVGIPSKGLDLVLKVAPAPGSKTFTYEQKAMETEVAMLRMLAGHPAIPAPKLHAVDFDGDVVPSKCFFVDFFTGPPWNRVRGRVGRASHATLEREFAAIQMAINAIKGDHFGFLVPNDDGRVKSETWYGAFSELVSILLEDYARFGIKVPAFATAAARRLPEHERSFVDVDGPSLVHWDLWEGNIFLEQREDGYHIQGVTDFERALWAEPYIEVSFWTPKRHAALVDCYGREAFEARDVQIRRAFYDLYLAMVMYLEQFSRGYSWLFSKSIGIYSSLRARQALRQLERAGRGNEL